MFKKSQDRKAYKSDLTDAQWAIMEPMVPHAKSYQRGGHPRTVDIREVLNTILYLHRSGCQWDMLPHDLLPKSTVYDYFSQWRDDGTWATIGQVLREQMRSAAGRDGSLSTAWIDSQSIKPTEIGGPERGYDSRKKKKGRKHHLLVSLGESLSLSGACEANRRQCERKPRLRAKFYGNRKKSGVYAHRMRGR